MTNTFSALFATPHNHWLGKTLYQLNNILVLLFFVLTFLVWGGTGFSVGVMLILSPFAFFVKDSNLQISKEEKLFFIALTLMFLSHSFAVFRGNPSFTLSDLDHPMRFALIIPVMLYLKKVRFNKSWFWLGVYAAGLICGWKSLTFTTGEYYTRVSGPFNPIIWGNIALVCALVSITKIHYLLKNNSLKNNLFSVELWVATIATFGAFSGVILSGSRGAWLTAILMLLTYLLYVAFRHSLKLSAIVLALSLLLSYVAYEKLPTINKRVDQVVTELTSFELSSSNKSSTGLRLQMWYTSLLVLKENPLTGLGEKGLTNFELQLVEQGKVNKWVATATSQQHSDIFDALAKNGLIGIAILLLFYTATIKLARNLVSPTTKAVVVTVMAYIGFGLTNTIFVGMNGTMFYLVFITFCASMTTKSTQAHP